MTGTVWPKPVFRCKELVHQGRPDRGLVVRCMRPAKYYIPKFQLKVCGYHKRAFFQGEPL